METIKSVEYHRIRRTLLVTSIVYALITILIISVIFLSGSEAIGKRPLLISSRYGIFSALTGMLLIDSYIIYKFITFKDRKNDVNYPTNVCPDQMRITLEEGKKVCKLVDQTIDQTDQTIDLSDLEDKDRVGREMGKRGNETRCENTPVNMTWTALECHS
jgi:hypothetical protein